MNITQQLANELNIKTQQVTSTIDMLDQGDTVPFIARYRKEATLGLDDTQLRTFVERLDYLRQLELRRMSILKSIEQQGLLNAKLQSDIKQCTSKTALEDLYLPFKPKRNSKANQAKAAGLQPLADSIRANDSCNPEYIAKQFVAPKQGISDTETALLGAQDIIIEALSEDAVLLGQLREWLTQQGEVKTKVKRGKKDSQSKFLDYFDYSESLRKLPAHRALAIFRGAKEGILNIQLNAPDHNALYPIKLIEHHLHLNKARRTQDYWLKTLAQQAWQTKLQPQLEADLSKALREKAESESIEVFATNLQDILMAAPAGQKVTMGLDPGFRSGVKVAIVSATGDFLVQDVIYPHAPQNKWDESIHRLETLINTHNIQLISIGNGTASRETESLVKALIKASTLDIISVVVSEAGASVYSASELASKEFPNVDVSIRGAISIARRLQDPLSELVKIEPKAIGVGQYQHDVNQKQLAAKLTSITEDCVNKVGVNLNNASVELLTKVAGINRTIAENIISTRESSGKFQDRKSLLKVPRLGTKAYQQCAGFLRLTNPNQPLDASAVHPESYPLVEKIADQLKVEAKELINNPDLLNNIDKEALISQQVGLYTISDVISELVKPGRDPRPAFEVVRFDESVNKIEDLKSAMVLEGIVTNVTNFGAFVDIGVHHDGLVHISQLSNTFVKDPHQVVKTGQIVSTRVLEVDNTRKRITLSMK